MPAHRPEFLADVLKKGFTETVNPFNANQRRRVELSPRAVDSIVLWSKDPRSLLEEPLYAALRPYAFYVQYTLNGYGADIEPGVPPLTERIDTYLRLADAFGPERVRWRYDPILLTPSFGISAHREAFGRIARALEGHADACTISFLDVYRRIEKAMRRLSMRPPEREEALEIARALSETAREHGISLSTCAEPEDYAAFGIRPARCIDAEHLSRIAGHPVAAQKDKNQRPHCGCAQAVDIGSYGRCPFGCAYCYASTGRAE